MTKKARTWIFIIVGTIVQVCMALTFVALFFAALYVLQPIIGDVAFGNMLFVGIICGGLLASFLYQKLVKWVVEKYDLEDKLEPLKGIRRNPLKRP